MRASGVLVGPGIRCLKVAMDTHLEQCTEGVDSLLLEGIGLCDRNMELLKEELDHMDAVLKRRTEGIDAIRRLKTIPGVGDVVAVAIYAHVGDVTRFPNAKTLAAYAGLVPSVRQSGSSNDPAALPGPPGVARARAGVGARGRHGRGRADAAAPAGA